MSDNIRILAVCGMGVGTSLILRMNIEKVMGDHNVPCEVTHLDLTSADAFEADIVFASKDIVAELKERKGVPVVVIESFIDLQEIEDKGLEAVEAHRQKQ